MNRIICLLVGPAAVAGALLSKPPASGAADEGAAAFVTQIPSPYRDWRLISVAHGEGNLHGFAAFFGNDIAIDAYREGRLLLPDGTRIAALRHRHLASEENNIVFGCGQSFVPGEQTNAQFMVRDSTKYASTGGCGFGHFSPDGKPADETFMEACFPRHEKAKASDLVFTHCAP